jgi:hypothetical protein
MNSNSGDGMDLHAGVNPANGAVIYYNVPSDRDSSALIIEIRNEAGNVIRSYSSVPDKNRKSYNGAPPSDPVLTTKPGINRIVWDLAHKTMPGAPEAYIEAGYRGHKAVPGKYTVMLKSVVSSFSQTFELKENPLYGLSEKDYQEYDAFLTSAEDEVREMHGLVNKLQKAQQQIREVREEMTEEQKSGTVGKMSESLMKKIKAWDEDMVQRKSKAYDDVENFPNKFTAEYLFMINQATSGIPRITNPVKERRKELDQLWEVLRKRGEEMINGDIPALNKALWESGFGALVVSSQ